MVLTDHLYRAVETIRADDGAGRPVVPEVDCPHISSGKVPSSLASSPKFSAPLFCTYGFLQLFSTAKQDSLPAEPSSCTTGNSLRPSHIVGSPRTRLSSRVVDGLAAAPPQLGRPWLRRGYLLQVTAAARWIGDQSTWQRIVDGSRGG